MTESKVWFITGSRSNFGLALVRAALAAGHRVVATARNPALLPFEPAPDTLLTLELDVTQQHQIEAAFEAAVRRFGRVDVVVNKSGHPLLGEIEAVPERDARALFDSQFWGPLAVCKTAVRVFREVNPPGVGGRIINITGPLAVLAAPTRGIIAASKAALEAATLSLARELPKEWNISAVNIEPGAFELEAIPGAYTVVPQPAAYANAAPGSGEAMMRARMGTSPPAVGDTDKMARALLELADVASAALPMRVPLGSDAWAYAAGIMKKGVEQLEKGKELARGAVRDGVDAEIVEERTLQMVAMF